MVAKPKDIRRADGFRGQILHVIPRPLLAGARQNPLVRELTPTNIGWFPTATSHFINRPAGADAHILILCIHGAGTYQVGRQEGTLTPGQALFLPRGIAHRYTAADPNPWSIHWMHFIGDDADYYLRNLPDDEFTLPLDPACLRDVSGVFRDAYRVLSGGYSGSALSYLSHLARHILGLIFYRNRAYSPTLRAPAGRDMGGEMDYLIDHCTESLTIDQLARRAGLSVNHYSLLFHQHAGLAPGQFLIQQRIRLACRLMDTSSLTIREIAAQVGYDDPYYFSRLFSKTMGHSPREYRRMGKG